MHLVVNTTNTCVPASCDCSNGIAESTTNWYPCQFSKAAQGDRDVEVCTSCNQYYHLDHDDCVSCNPDNFNVGVCKLNECECTGGTAKQTTCSTHEAHECESCDDVTYHVDINSLRCEVNICSCDHGDPADDTCVTHEAHNCKTCDDTYHKDGNSVCIENVCKCDNGSAVNNNACTVDGANQCATCNNFYHPVTDDQGIMSCEINICTCDYGTEKTVDCKVHNGHECAQCDNYYDIQGDICVPNQCICTNGQASTDPCSTLNEENCISCNDGYYPDGSTCSEKVCICKAKSTHIDFYLPLDQTTPTGATGTDCPENGEIVCASCGNGDARDGGKWFHVHNLDNDGDADMIDPHYNHCVLNSCYCDHGTPKQAYACPEHLGHYCDACDGDRIINNDFHCVNTKCNCQHGQGWSTNGLCNNGRRHDSCEFNQCFTGYHSVAANNDITWTDANNQVRTHTPYECVDNQCTCDNGEGSTGPDCVNHNTPHCASCNIGYKPDGDACIPNVCTCDNGTGKSNGTFSYI